MKIAFILLIGLMSLMHEARHIRFRDRRHHKKRSNRGLKMKSYNPRARYIPKSRNLKPVRPSRHLEQKEEKVPYKQDAEFREAWKEFKAAHDPKLDLLTVLKKKTSTQTNSVPSERKLLIEDTNQNGTSVSKEAENNFNFIEAQPLPEFKDYNGKGRKLNGDQLVDNLITRASTLDDKIDHLLMHNGHDLAGKMAYYTPYGIQVLPKMKSKNSVDQKLKMVDYMHNLGGGYNPVLHTMLPYYLSNGEQDQKNGIAIENPMRRLTQLKTGKKVRLI